MCLLIVLRNQIVLVLILMIEPQPVWQVWQELSSVGYSSRTRSLERLWRGVLDSNLSSSSSSPLSRYAAVTDAHLSDLGDTSCHLPCHIDGDAAELCLSHAVLALKYFSFGSRLVMSLIVSQSA